MYLFDTHAHLNDARLMPERVELVARAADADVKYINVVGYDFASSFNAVKIAKEFENVYATIGIHPHDADEWTAEHADEFRKLLDNHEENKIVGIGEIGFDLHFPDRHADEVQKQAFIGQMELAYEYDLPVSIHSRDAADMTLANLAELKEAGKLHEKPGVIHCFDYGVDEAKRFEKFNFLFGVDGPVTFKNGEDKRELVRYLPLEKILLETDCPYMAPEPYRGKRNEPSLIPFIGKKIAEEKGLSFEHLAEVTTNNGLELFRIKK